MWAMSAIPKKNLLSSPVALNNLMRQQRLSAACTSTQYVKGSRSSLLG